MTALTCLSLLTSFGVSLTGGTSTVSGAGSARTPSNNAFSYTAAAQKVLQTNGSYKYYGSFSLQTYVGHDLVNISIPAWSKGTWSGKQASLLAYASVRVTHAGKTTGYHGGATVLFVDNAHGQNSTSTTPPPCDCVCVTWKDKYSNLTYNFLGTVQRGGSVTVH